MNLYVQQSISINSLKITNITNSSVLQIGSAGTIKPVSNLFNTGGFTGPAPQAATPGTQISTSPGTSPSASPVTFVPLAASP